MNTLDLFMLMVASFQPRPVLLLQPNGDKVPCQAHWDADGTLVLSPIERDEH